MIPPMDGRTVGDCGAIAAGTRSELNVDTVRFAYNAANDQGGAITAAEDSVLTIANSTIENNAPDRTGGGINADTGSIVRIDSTTIANNGSGARGGGVSHETPDQAGATTSVITKSTITGNSAATRGGGICSRGDLGVVNTTVTFNSTGDNNQRGGGIGDNDFGAGRSSPPARALASTRRSTGPISWSRPVHRSRSTMTRRASAPTSISTAHSLAMAG